MDNYWDEHTHARKGKYKWKFPVERSLTVYIGAVCMLRCNLNQDAGHVNGALYKVGSLIMLLGY